MSRRRANTTGLTLLELLIVLSLMVVLAGLVIPRSEPTLRDQLESAAQVLASDLAYGRCLAVVTNSSYCFRFDPANNKYTFQHSGAAASLNDLPRFPYPSAEDTPTQHVVALKDLPHVGATVRLAAVVASGTVSQPVGDLEFGPLGGTTRSAGTVIWLCAGKGAAIRYISLSVNPITGLATVGSYSGSGPGM